MKRSREQKNRSKHIFEIVVLIARIAGLSFAVRCISNQSAIEEVFEKVEFSSSVVKKTETGQEPKALWSQEDTKPDPVDYI